MGTITTIGLDIAKSVFQVHGIDAAGEVVVRRRTPSAFALAVAKADANIGPAVSRDSGAIVITATSLELRNRGL